MVTNINLVAPDAEIKTKASGKSTLILSIGLVVLAVILYMGLSAAAASYKNNQTGIEQQIQQTKTMLAGGDYAGVVDFQERLNILSQAMEDHTNFDAYLREISKYVLPSVRLTSLKWSENDRQITIAGTAPNFDALSQAMILLKKCPIFSSLEFKSASESALSATTQPGIDFQVEALVKPDTLNK